MTEKERYIETILFGKPDKIPLMPGGPRESTLKRWHNEGLPEDANWYDILMKELGIKIERAKASVNLNLLSFKMIPQFEEKILEHKDGHYIVQDWQGAIVEIADNFDLTYLRGAKDFVTRKWHKFPVENKSDWETMKEKYNSNTPERYAEDLKEKCEKIKNRDYVFGIHFNGPFWQLREWCGFENLCMLMAENPEFIEEMVNFWQEFVLTVLEPVLSRVHPDYILISEDMAYKEKSMISPAMVRKFLLPSWKNWVKRVKESGCSIIEVDSDGYVEELIPLWIEAGINVCSHIEIAAGNDLLKYREKFGKKMAYRGGVDKRLIAKGGKELENELYRLIPPLLKDGGFIPSCDHGVPPDISWKNFIEYTRILAKLTGWIK